jgi:hypothetical protein
MALGSGTGFRLADQFRRLRVRYETRAEIDEAFQALACALICLNTLERHNGTATS